MEDGGPSYRKGFYMPIGNVAMLKGRSPEYKKTVLDCIHQGLVDAIGIEDWDRFQRITEYDREDFEFPSFKTDAFMIIEMKFFPGRTKEQKKVLIENITHALKERLSVDPSDVFIVIEEPDLENWGIGGKQK